MKCVLSLQNTNVDDGTGFINDLPLLKSEYLIFVSHFYDPVMRKIILILLLMLLILLKSINGRHIGIVVLNRYLGLRRRR
jgi:hypothetical protein